MSFRVRSFLPWLAAVAGLAAVAAPVPAQPPSPLELVRGLRENGQGDLAVEYLKVLEGKPLSDDDRAALLLERSKCMLDASEDEPDEGTRQGMIAQAKEGLSGFVLAHPNHPRAVEGLLSLAKLTSLDAKETLSRARRIDVPAPSDDPDEQNARDKAQDRQKAEAAKARPQFQLAATRFADASKRLRERLDGKGDKEPDFVTRRTLEREAFEAELASGVNQFSIAETYMPEKKLTGPEKAERNKFLEKAKEAFQAIARREDGGRGRWVAQAWVAEAAYELGDSKAGEAEAKKVRDAVAPEAADGRRLVAFFSVRRNVLDAIGSGNSTKIGASVKEMEAWLDQYGGARRPTPEVYAVNYYLARTLHYQADARTPRPKAGEAPKVDATAMGLYDRAERIYRKLAQSDHEYTARASKYRMLAVRRMLGEADQNPLAYATFERAQMASLIQLGKLGAAEGKRDQLLGAETPNEAAVAAAAADVRAARDRAIALLERARELAGPQDSPGDVTDVLLRLIYYYSQNEQYQQAAVLGDFVAHTVKSTGGKAAVAGLLGLNGYLAAGRTVKGDSPEAIAAARQTDRDRAVALARFLDEKYPNDTATDSARHRLAGLLADEKKFPAAFDVLAKVRPGYAQLTGARLLRGYIASELIRAPELAAPEKARVYRHATAELRKVPQPSPFADEDEVREYLMARWRLALLMLSQERADPETEGRDAGFNQALNLTKQALAEIPAFDCLKAGDGLNPAGLELNFLLLDINTRALYLRARAMTRNGQFDGALELVKPVLDAVGAKGPLVTAELKGWAGLAGSAKPEDKQKARAAQYAAAVDKGRVDVILAAFRVQVRQGKADEAAKLLDLMVKAGGTVEESLPLLEPVGKELAALMLAAQRAGRADEAKNLGAGLGVLLNKIRAVKDLPVPSLLFIGQTLQSIGQNAEALETLKKVPAPTVKDWEKKKPEELPAEERGKFQNQVRDHALALYGTARAHTGLKQFAEAEKVLKDAIGDNAKPGWGSGRLYLRKALAENYEAKGAAEPDPRKANAEWNAAAREWTLVANIQRNQLTKLPPVPREATAEHLANFVRQFHEVLAGVAWFHGTAEQVSQIPAARLAFADALFDEKRCALTANIQVVKDPAKLQKAYDATGKAFADVEKQFPAADWTPEVHNRYHEFIKANKALEDAYKAAGGKMFLTEKRAAQ